MPKSVEYLDLSVGQGIAQALAHRRFHDWIFASPNQQSGRLEAGQGALQIGVRIIVLESLIEHREPDPERDAGSILSLTADEIRVHWRRRIPPGNHEGRIRLDGLFELADFPGKIEPRRLLG